METKIREKKVSFKDAIELVKKNSSAKFDESIDLNLRINLKQSKGGDFNLRTVLKLPNGNGKNKRNASAGGGGGGEVLNGSNESGTSSGTNGFLASSNSDDSTLKSRTMLEIC